SQGSIAAQTGRGEDRLAGGGAEGEAGAQTPPRSAGPGVSGSETLRLSCGACGNQGTALREAGDRAPYYTTGNFFLRYPSINSASLQIVCGQCGRVQPLDRPGRGKELFADTRLAKIGGG